MKETAGFSGNMPETTKFEYKAEKQAQVETLQKEVGGLAITNVALKGLKVLLDSGISIAKIFGR